MVTQGFDVIQPGLQSTMQDWPGRVGHWRVGIPPSGPMDSLSFRLANLLVGNPEGTPAIEFQFLGPKLRALVDIDVAITGCESNATIEGEPLTLGQTVTLHAGQTLNCGAAKRGARGYLAVAGGFAKPPVLGSAATFPRGGIGGSGLTAGDMLEVQAPASGGPRLRLRADAIELPSDPAIVEVTAGPHFDWLNADGRAALLASTWKVSVHSDRTGIRLSGPAIGFSQRAIEKAPENGQSPTNVINTGYAIGGVNLCGETPIILPFDGPSQGGFITPLVVTSAALRVVGQVRPGQSIRFRRITLDDAIRMRQRLDKTVTQGPLETLGKGAGRTAAGERS